MGGTGKAVMRFLFPFTKVHQGARVVIYGAGEVGYDFYRQLITSGYALVTLWVDRQYEWLRKLNLPVDAPEKIIDVKYDFVVITAEHESVYESICRDLYRLGVSGEKYIWSRDYRIQGNIVLGYEDRNLKEEMKNALEGDASIFLNENRLDIVIRYMFAVEILNGISNGCGEHLYRKFIYSGCNAMEPTENYISAYFSEYSQKRGIKAFLSSFKELVYSMSINGYLKEQFVPIDSRGNLINGAHRAAAALACKKPIWYVKYPFAGLRYECNEDTLGEMSFSLDEIGMIKKVYEDIICSKQM